MRCIKASFFAILIMATIFSVPAMAGKYCVQGPNMGYPGDCSYSNICAV